MKCLTKYTLQSLIDNELSAAEKLRAETHIAHCET
ncbi:MAG: zf-HC2 domain-containing protein, partial [Paludibacter sp.]|nr:zf-HC2 domain-containing protein [Paludibacter sp.]